MVYLQYFIKFKKNEGVKRMIIQPNSKLVMIGDSVTDCERARPYGEGLFGAIGKGYVSNVEASIMSKYPERKIRVVNMGTSGNTVRDLKDRWDNDVINLNPDWLSIMIGINDVWRQFDLTLQYESHVYLDEYEITLEDLIVKTKPSLKGLILMTPYYMEPNLNDAMRSKMDEYGNVVKKLSKKYDTYFVDTQAAFDKFFEHYHPNMLAWDRIHPNNIGHMILSNEFLKVIEF